MSGIYERMFECNVRIEESWPFPMSPTPERLVEALAERSDLPEPLARYFGRLSEEDRDLLYDGRSEAEDILADICGDMFCDGVFGWVGIAATPYFTPMKGGGASFSWGHYYTKLLFAPTAEELLGAACDWAEETYERDTASAMSAGTAETAQQAQGQRPASAVAESETPQ